MTTNPIISFVPISFTRGDDYSIQVTVTSDGTTPVNITGRTYAAQIRATPDATTDIAFTCTVTSGAGGVVTCTLSDVDTATLAAGSYVWDIQQTNAGQILTFAGGTCTVYADVTRP